jgi:peptidoglycan-N-acetylglucosamine deacetylase
MTENRKIAYLTIDDAPTEDFRGKSDYLHSKGIQAILFCTGEQLENYPEEAAYAISQGHILANHSYNHPRFSDIDIAAARDQIERTDRLLDEVYAIAGTTRPIKAFRFPFLNNGSKGEQSDGGWNDEHVRSIQRILSEFGYKQPNFKNLNYAWYKNAGLDMCLNVDCTYDTFDWCLADGQEQFGYCDLPTILGRMEEDVPEGRRGLNYPHSNEIVMMHAWIPMDAFTVLVERMLAKGIEFRLPELP